MTEAEWLTCDDLPQMLVVLENSRIERNRKLRLFMVACCRIIWSGFHDVRSRTAIEVAEQYAEGLVTPSEMRAAFLAAYDAVDDCRDHSPFSEDLAIAAFLTAARNITESDTNIPESEDAYEMAAHVWSYAIDGSYPEPRKRQSTLLRDIFGNPFRPVAFDPEWRTEQTIGIALKMYDERNFAAMPILADALQEAGCEDEQILSHCRELGEHVRGCWVVDLVLEE